MRTILKSNTPQVKGDRFRIRPDIPSDNDPTILQFAELPEPSNCLMVAFARLFLAWYHDDRRAIEFYRNEIHATYGWVIRPPASPPEWRRR